jgi:predicted small metal-binding protein
MSYRCSELVPECRFQAHDAHEDGLLARAEEHLKTEHPDEAIERERVRAILRTTGGPP